MLLFDGFVAGGVQRQTNAVPNKTKREENYRFPGGNGNGLFQECSPSGNLFKNFQMK